MCPVIARNVFCDEAISQFITKIASPPLADRNDAKRENPKERRDYNTQFYK